MTTFVTSDTICSAVKLNVLLGGGGEACFLGWRHRKLRFGLHVA